MTMLPKGAIHLAPGFQLRWDEPSQRHVLKHAQGLTIPLNATQGTVLQHCNGSETPADIVEKVTQQFPTTDSDEVWEYLRTAYANNWIHGQ